MIAVDICRYLEAKLKRKLSEEEMYMIHFTYNRAYNNGKETACYRLLDIMRKESD